MKKLFLCSFITVFFTSVLHAEDTPYMKLIDSHKGIDKMLVCLPMIQKASDMYKKGIQISIKEDSIDVREYLNKKNNPPYKFKSFHGLMKGYHEAVLVRMVGEWWIAVRIPEEEEAKKKYQKKHIINKAINLSYNIPYTEHPPYLTKCMDGFNQLAKENDLIKKYIEILNKKVEEEIYDTLKNQVVEKENIIHLSCVFKEATEYDVNFKETEIETEPREITWSFDLNKQILLDTNFKNNPPVVASIDKSYIEWHFYAIPDDADKLHYKQNYNEDIWVMVTTHKINRSSGKATLNLYALDKAYFLAYGGAEANVEENKIEKSKVDMNTQESLQKRIQLFHLLSLMGNNKIQKELLHTVKQNGECRKITKTKQF